MKLLIHVDCSVLRKRVATLEFFFVGGGPAAVNEAEISIEKCSIDRCSLLASNRHIILTVTVNSSNIPKPALSCAVDGE